MKTPIQTHTSNRYKFPETYPIASATVRETPKGYQITLHGRPHPNRDTLPATETMWVSKRRVKFPCLENAARWASHTAAARRIRTHWEGLCIVTQWRAARLPESACSEAARDLREVFGPRATYKDENCQKYMLSILRRECEKFGRDLPPRVLEDCGVN